MNRRHHTLLKFVLVFVPPIVFGPSVRARPLLTEEVATIGYLHVEAGASISYRRDEFGLAPTKTYETANFPIFMKFGFSSKGEIGFDVNYQSHKLKYDDVHLSGSTSADFSPMIKYSPWEWAGLKVLWHTAQREDTNSELPIGHGDDIEVLGLLKIPFPVGSFHFNSGYVWRANYPSQFGIRGGLQYTVQPGNIFENRAALELPLKWNINLLTELAYYHVGQEIVENVRIDGSEGEAMDVLTGLTWAYGGWNVGGGVAFGLLDERHTSFDLTRGAGDWKTQFTISYKLTPRKPEQQ